MPNHDNENDKGSFFEYRLGKLEESFATLSANLNTLKEIFLKWDAKMNENGWPLQCGLHNERMANIHKRLDDHQEEIKSVKTDVAEIKSIVYKASGILIVLSVAVQLLGPILLDKVFGHSQQPTIEYVQPK